MFRVHYRYHLFAPPHNTKTHTLFLWLIYVTRIHSHTHTHTHTHSHRHTTHAHNISFLTYPRRKSTAARQKMPHHHFHLKNAFADSLPFFPSCHWCCKQKSISNKQQQQEIWKTNFAEIMLFLTMVWFWFFGCMKWKYCFVFKCRRNKVTKQVFSRW